MLHIIMGTKAQLIKMYGVIHYLEENNVDWNYIDTMQHAAITEKIRKTFGVRDPDYKITGDTKNIIKNGQGIVWMTKVLFKGLWNRKKMFKKDKKGIAIVHGDTMSTLLGAILAKLGGQRLIHVESGYRTQKLFKPFPEEICRRLVDRWSYINFTCRPDGDENLRREKNKSRIVNAGENTLLDAVRFAQTMDTGTQLPESYVLVSMHRYETIHSKKRMQFVVDNLLRMSEKENIVWGLHEPTREALKRFDLLKPLEENEQITLQGLFDYPDFMKAIGHCKFLITDGGGPQDETRYLNVPCLLIRTENEKPGHHNAYQCGFDQEKFDYFLANFNQYREHRNVTQPSPSKKVVETLMAELAQ